jgi:hypothetical protein
MTIMLDWTRDVSTRCGRNLNYILTVATLVARYANEANVARMVDSG